MERYEYKVIPAPEKGLKAKGIRSPQDRFAHAVEVAMNQLGADGWEYWRAECLPSTERAGLTSSKITERHMLVFRRPLIADEPPARVIVAEALPESVEEPVAEQIDEPPAQPRMPVFTRRIEMAREQREAVLQRSDLDPTEPEDDYDIPQRRED